MSANNAVFARAVRRAVGSTPQRDVAAVVGVSHATIGDMLRGRVPSRQMLEQFAEKLRLDVSNRRRLFLSAGYVPEDMVLATEADVEELVAKLESRVEIADLNNSHTPTFVPASGEIQNCRRLTAITLAERLLGAQFMVEQLCLRARWHDKPIPVDFRGIPSFITKEQAEEVLAACDKHLANAETGWERFSRCYRQLVDCCVALQVPAPAFPEIASPQDELTLEQAVVLVNELVRALPERVQAEWVLLCTLCGHQ